MPWEKLVARRLPNNSMLYLHWFSTMRTLPEPNSTSPVKIGRNLKRKGFLFNHPFSKGYARFLGFMHVSTSAFLASQPFTGMLPISNLLQDSGEYDGIKDNHACQQPKLFPSILDGSDVHKPGDKLGWIKGQDHKISTWNRYNVIVMSQKKGQVVLKNV